MFKRHVIEKKIGTFIADEIIKNNIRDEYRILLDIKKGLLNYKYVN